MSYLYFVYVQSRAITIYQKLVSEPCVTGWHWYLNEIHKWLYDAFCDNMWLYFLTHKKHSTTGGTAVGGNSLLKNNIIRVKCPHNWERWLNHKSWNWDSRGRSHVFFLMGIETSLEPLTHSLFLEHLYLQDSFRDLTSHMRAMTRMISLSSGDHIRMKWQTYKYPTAIMYEQMFFMISRECVTTPKLVSNSC